METKNWRDGFLIDGNLFFTRWNAQENLQNATVQEIVNLGNRLAENICEFQAELIDGRIFAGRGVL